MKNKNICLDYKEENGDLRNDLKNGVHDMEKAEGFSAEEFYFNLDKVIRELDANKSQKIAKYLLDKIRPTIYFGAYFYILRSLDRENKLEAEFDYLRQFVDYKFDIFMIANYIR